MRGRAFQSNFAMGILDEEGHGRVDLEVYVAALGDCANGIPSTLGSVRRRPGFLDEGAVKDQADFTVLIPFRRGGDQLQLEFGDGYMRVREPDGGYRMNGGAPFEIATPYAPADLAGLRWDQSNDVLYLAHASRTIRPHRLRRDGPLSWSLDPLEARNGPWLAENDDPALTMTVSALRGVGRILTASAPLFTAGMVGERLRLRTPDGQPSCATWTPSTDFKAFELVQSDGKLYVGETTGRKSGTAAPLHESGVVSDGNLNWTYLSDGAGVVRITAFTSATQVTVTVERTLPGWIPDGDRKGVCADPDTIDFGPSSRWAFGAWSDRTGWPGDVAVLDEERIAFSGPKVEPGRYDVSAAFGFGPDHVDFTPGLGSGRVTDDDALRGRVKGGADPIEWLLGGTALMFGTASREGVIQGDTLEDPLAPAGNRPRVLTLTGSDPIKAVLAHDGALFVPLGGRGLNFLGLGLDGSLRDIDLALFAEDLVADQVAGLAWAPRPDRTAWLWTRAGRLLSVTFQPRQNQWGWARHPLPGGWSVEWVSVITGADGRDLPWLVVRRTKGGQTQRRVWRLAPRWRSGDPLEAVIYLDGAGLYDGAAVSSIGGLAHLAGETVRVFGNGGALIFDAVVSGGGAVTAPAGETLTRACIGHRYLFEARSLPMDQGVGDTVGAKQRVLDVTVLLADAVSAEVAFGDGPIQDAGGKPWAANPSPGNLVFKGKVGGETTRDARWTVRTDDCWPLTLRAVRASVSVDD